MASATEQTDIECERVAFWIRWYAGQRGLSLDKLAAYSDLGRNSVIEMGRKRIPNLATLASVAAFLGVQVRDLLRDIPPDGSDPSNTPEIPPGSE